MAENDVSSTEKTILTWKYNTQLITSATCLMGQSKYGFLGESMVRMQHKNATQKTGKDFRIGTTK